jgi:hypothetical protein
LRIDGGETHFERSNIIDQAMNSLLVGANLLQGRHSGRRNLAGRLASGSFARYELGKVGDAAQILRYNLGFGYLDLEVGFEEFDELQDAGGVNDARRDQRVIISRSACHVPEEVIFHDELGQLRPDLCIHSFSNLSIILAARPKEFDHFRYGVSVVATPEDLRRPV